MHITFCGVNIYEEVTYMTNYRKILRLHSLRINNIEITASRLCARNSVIPPAAGGELRSEMAASETDIGQATLANH